MNNISDSYPTRLQEIVVLDDHVFQQVIHDILLISDPNIQKIHLQTLVNKQSLIGETALHVLCQHADQSRLVDHREKLCQYGGKEWVLLKDRHNSSTVLHALFSLQGNPSLEVVEKLCE